MQSNLSQPHMHTGKVGRAFVTGTRKMPAGFTLVELLVVIGIIALLISILLPSLNKAREQAQMVSCLSNERQIIMAMIQYTMDYKGQLPMYGHYYATNSEDPQMYWWITLAPYISSEGKYAGSNFMRCPSDRDPTRNFTYGVHYGKIPYAPFTYSAVPGSNQALDPGYGGSKKITQVGPGTFLLGDKRHVQIGGGGDAAIYTPNHIWTLNRDYDDDGVMDSNADALGILPNPQNPYNHADPRHGGSINFAFADGSARPVKVRDFANNKDDIWGVADNR